MVDPGHNALGLDEQNCDKLLSKINEFDKNIHAGIGFSHMLIKISDIEFLLYNSNLDLGQLSIGDPNKVVLKPQDGPDLLQYKSGIVPLAIPTKCNAGHTLVTAGNGNRVCPYATHKSDYWYCTNCGAIRAITSITHSPVGSHSSTCLCTVCNKVKGLY